MPSKFVIQFSFFIFVTLLVGFNNFQSNNYLEAKEMREHNSHQEEDTHLQPINHHENHHHDSLEIPKGTAVPEVDLVIHQDKVRGWNLEIKVNNFRFAPEKINDDSQYQEGHAHLYINGKQITRIYSKWYYIPELTLGEHQIKVGLNSNNHQPLSYQGKMIEDTEIIKIP